MKKIYIIFGIVVILIIVAVWHKNSPKIVPLAASYKDATYIIDGKSVTLKNGLSETEIPDSDAKVVTRYFGNEVKHDLDDDGRKDIAFLLTQETGGSGTFFYVVAALNTTKGYVGSQALLLGDRIAPQTTVMDERDDRKNVIVVNYAVRLPGEPFTARPSLGKSIWIKLDPKTMQFGEVAQSFEGESDPSKMTLGMKTWNWVRTTYNDDMEIKPKVENKFTLTFKGDKTFSASTDCNGIGGEYAASGTKISFDKMISTKMYCEGSQESSFSKMLGEAESYHFTSKGELILELKLDSGSMIFR
ncbi:MAG TPA: META domain-containing protein [Candidatus Paceibacterota bacterium]